jgi:SAM-dependent methyltransferase
VDRRPPRGSAPPRTVLNPIRGSLASRPFTPREAILFESLIAGSLADLLTPLLDSALPDGDILDVGCGGGSIAGRLASGARRVVGVDASPTQVRRFRSRGCDNASAVTGFAEALPFRDRAFDGLYSTCVLKHWIDPALALSEAARVVRPGGRVVLVELDGDTDAATFARFAATTAIPAVFHSLYVSYSMRTVIEIAPTAARLADLLELGPLSDVTVTRLPRQPFVAVTAVVPAGVPLTPVAGSAGRSTR